MLFRIWQNWYEGVALILECSVVTSAKRQKRSRLKKFMNVVNPKASQGSVLFFDYLFSP